MSLYINICSHRIHEVVVYCFRSYQSSSFLVSGGAGGGDMEVIRNINTRACGHTTPPPLLFKERVCLMQLHTAGLSAPALFHLKVIICYGNSDVKLVQVGLGARNKYKVHHRGLELLLGLGVAHLCRSPLIGPMFWRQQSARRGQGVGDSLGRECPFLFLLF